MLLEAPFRDLIGLLVISVDGPAPGSFVGTHHSRKLLAVAACKGYFSIFEHRKDHDFFPKENHSLLRVE